MQQHNLDAALDADRNEHLGEIFGELVAMIAQQRMVDTVARIAIDASECANLFVSVWRSYARLKGRCGYVFFLASGHLVEHGTLYSSNGFQTSTRSAYPRLIK